MKDGAFVWYELITSNSAAAADFYAGVVGWTMEDAGMPGITYTLAKLGNRPVGGVMDIMPEMVGVSPTWFGYIGVGDVDATAEKVKAAGGAIHRAPGDIPGVGRFAVCADPQGAAFMLFHGDGDPAPELATDTPGAIGWHELTTKDWEKAWDFYSGLFGWEKQTAIDMGDAGTYQTFTIGGKPAGGMMSLPDAPPAWRYYFGCDDIDAGAKRIADGGGTIQFGPLEVPGGIWIVAAADPQGASFALLGPKKLTVSG